MTDIVVDVGINDNDTTEISLNELINQIKSREVGSLQIWDESSDERVGLIMQSISEVLVDGSSLNSLEFRGSSFKDEGAIAIAAELPKFSDLTAIYIVAEYGNEGARALCEAVAAMSNVTQLALRGPFSDAGVEDVIWLMANNTKLQMVDVSEARIGSDTYQHLLQVMKENTSIESFDFPHGSTAFQKIPLAWIEDCFTVNMTLTNTNSFLCASIAEPIMWFAHRNRICKEIGAEGQSFKTSIPRAMKGYEEMRKFMTDQVEIIQLRAQVIRMHEKEVKEDKEHKVQLLQCEENTKKGMAKEYLEKARSMLDEKKPIEAMCLLQCALELDDSEEMKRIGEETKEEIKEYAKILAAQHKRMDVWSKQGE